MATGIIYQAARTAVVAFFAYGGKTLAPPPPLDQSRAMLAAYLVTIALVLWVTIEQLGMSLDPIPKGRRGRLRRQRSNPAWRGLFSLAQDIFSAFGISSTSGSDERRRKRGRG